MVTKRVMIESPYTGDIPRNISYALAALKDSLERDEAPFLSHLLYTQVLADHCPEQRKLALIAAGAWLEVADLVAVYEDLGVSDGMKAAIGKAKRFGISVVSRFILDQREKDQPQYDG